MKTINLLSYVILKDVLIMVIYLVLLRFNLTNETYSEEMISNFPAASESGIIEILLGAIYASWILILIDIIIIKCIYGLIIKKYFEKITNGFIIGFVLNLPIVILYVSIMEVNKTLIMSMAISLMIACLAYVYMGNNPNTNLDIVD